MMSEGESTKSPEEFVTTSRVKTWFMVQFKGYQVVERREVPKVTRQGRLTYDCFWQLRPHEGLKEPAPDAQSW